MSIVMLANETDRLHKLGPLSTQVGGATQVSGCLVPRLKCPAGINF